MMDELHLLGSTEWRNRSPDADQEYFIDKMRMLKTKLRKYEEENRALYRWLAEQKIDVKEALRDKCFVINKVQHEMNELKKHILLLHSVISDEPQSSMDQNQNHGQHVAEQLLLLHHHHSTSSSFCSTSSQAAHSDPDRSIWMSRNKSLEENFKKELKKVKELERQVVHLSESLQEVGRDREDLQEKNAFIEEENNIQREQIALLEDTVRDLEEVSMRTGPAMEDASTQTEVRGLEMRATLNETVGEIFCLVSKLTELRQENEFLESKYEGARKSLAGLHEDFHVRGKLMSELENELNALKLRDRSSDRCERRRRPRSGSRWEEEEQRVSEAVVNFDASVFLSPNSSRSGSSNSSAEFEVEDEEGEVGSLSLSAGALKTKKTELRKFIRNLKHRRRTAHDAYRCSV